MPAYKKADEEEKHFHSWYLIPSKLSEERCKCGNIKISASEEERRRKEWNNYFQMVTTTQNYSDYKVMRELFIGYLSSRSKSDLDALKEMDRTVIMARNHEVVDEYGHQTIEPNNPDSLLPKPNFPDPNTWNGYVIA